MASGTPQGFRGNNPGNIVATKIAWEGEVMSSGRFEKFESPVMGLRALFILLMNYHKAGHNTVKKIIFRWAPKHENNTEAYVKNVAKFVGVGADEIIQLNANVLIPLAQAIVRQENGANKTEPFWYPLGLYQEALELAMRRK